MVNMYGSNWQHWLNKVICFPLVNIFAFLTYELKFTKTDHNLNYLVCISSKMMLHFCGFHPKKHLNPPKKQDFSVNSLM